MRKENNYLLLYDPYYHEIKQVKVDEFVGMWCSENYKENGVINDFIVIKNN